MNNIKVDFQNLTENEKNQLMQLVAKANSGVKLSEIPVGETFKIGEIEFIKLEDTEDGTHAVTKDIVFTSQYGDNNFADSEILKKLKSEFMPKIYETIGEDNVCSVGTDLKTLDGLEPYPYLVSKVSIPTFECYRKNVKIFDKYKVDECWWLATPDTAPPHSDPSWRLCVSPSGFIGSRIYHNYFGVRPFLSFVSSIIVSRSN